ncbi:hypothetical protein VHEMI06551 [[Torrubiella] hemipterigena]|uniref:SH3 domain-containing protein n=1 Tax=[Torrubiella] hemipterigena TaxID=1531966 RepID=A0A0A1TJR0_9HYPO|nr:hypothetical protein VHEMI06551 [[Torrubiella] hemipterigena]
MRGYGSPYSPSLGKMEHSRPYGRRGGIQMGNVLGDPFALATISIAMLAFLISFISVILAQIDNNNRKAAWTNTQTGPFPDEFNRFCWWAVFYTLFLNITVFIVIASDAVQTYHVAVSSYAAAGMVLVSSSVNTLIYSSVGSRQAAAAGMLLLAIIDIVWVFYFGSTPASTPRAFVDSFALTKESAIRQQAMSNYGGVGRPETSNSVAPPQMYTTSSQLNGFENASPVGPRGNNMQTFASTTSVSQQQQQLQPQAAVSAPTQPSQPPSSKSPGADAEVGPPTEYPYRAKAIYSYDANPEDANEISFGKHEILEVSDISGRWWQARKENGETGIAPSNYLVLV